MNPFDLTGPEFLLFYMVFAVVVIALHIGLRWIIESGSAPKIDLADPYLIAYLRGGEREALCVALVSLIDRGLLVYDGTHIQRAANAGPHSVHRPLEKALLETYAKAGTTASIDNDPALQAVCDHFQETLKRVWLLPNESLVGVRVIGLIVVMSLLGGVAAVKVYVALERGRTNVGFLVFLAIVALVIVAKLAFPRLTSRGTALLADIQSLYSGLKERAASIRPGGASVDVVMLAAAYGVGALTGDGFIYTRTLFPNARPAQSGSSWITSWGSSCSTGSSCSSGSSCSGGSSCGGGGCGGGCGGCGS